jgi:DNA-binding CsgD family transcriptional regulator
VGLDVETGMRQSQGSYRQLARQSLQYDVVRGALAVLLMVVLWLAGLPLWLVLPLPFLAYAGLRWLTAQPTRPEAYVKCLEVQRKIHKGLSNIEDAQTNEEFRRNIFWIDKSLDAIAEDAKYEFSEPLLALTGITNELLVDYLKVVRRGFDDAEVRERVRGNLETLDIQYDGLWKQLNRDTVENLKELSDSIDETKKELEEQPDPPGLPSELPETVEESVPPEAAELPGGTLTPRELRVLELIAAGRSDREIGEELFISTRTASDHVSNILRKLGVGTRAEAAAWAVRNGLA